MVNGMSIFTEFRARLKKGLGITIIETIAAVVWRMIVIAGFPIRAIGALFLIIWGEHEVSSKLKVSRVS